MKINNVIKTTSLVFIYIQIYFKIKQKYWNKDEKYKLHDCSFPK